MPSASSGRKLYIYCSDDARDIMQDAVEQWSNGLSLEGEYEITPTFERAMAHLTADINNTTGYVILEVHYPIATQMNIKPTSHSVHATTEHIVPILRSIAWWNYLLDLSNTHTPFRETIRINFFETINKTGTAGNCGTWEPNGDNLNVSPNNSVHVDADKQAVYGFNLINDSGRTLYPYLIYFDLNTQSIVPHFLGSASDDVNGTSQPLLAHSSLALGHGPTNQPFSYSSPTGRACADEIGFVKLFVATSPVDFSGHEQKTCWDSARHRESWPTHIGSGLAAAELWDTQLMILVQHCRAPLTDSQDSSGSADHRISRSMPSDNIIKLLVKHGCTDITLDLNLKQCDTQPLLQGGFGEVYQGKLHSSNTKVAIKRIKNLSSSENLTEGNIAEAARELHAWSKFDHDNVIKLLGLAQFRGKLSMVSPWMAGGSLRDYLKKNPSADRCKLSYQIANGLAYMHERGSVHGDLKGANVLISAEGVAKLNDFGNTVLKTYSLQFTQGVATSRFSLRWTAPELLTSKTTYSVEGDVYALGMTIYEAITGEAPFPGLTDLVVCNHVINTGMKPSRPEDDIPVQSKHGDILWRLLDEHCWAYSPKDRATAADVRDIMNMITMRGLKKIPVGVSAKGDGEPVTLALHELRLFDGPTKLRSSLSTITGRITTGRYRMVNVKWHVAAVLSGESVGLGVMTTDEATNIGSTWEVTLLENGNYLIRNHNYGLLAECMDRAVRGDVVTSGTRAHEWTIQEAQSKGQYRISPTYTGVFWGHESGEPNIPIKLYLSPDNQSNLWHLVEA